MGIAVGLTLQVATRLVDRVAPRRIIITGTSVALAGGTALGIATAYDASYVVLGACGVALGVGSGATLMPTMTSAVRHLEGADTPRATTLLALFSQLATALGTALVATTLTVAVDQQVPALTTAGGGGVAGMVLLDDATRAGLQPDLALAVAAAYAVVVVLLALAVGAATRIGARRTRDREARSDSLVPRPRPTRSPPNDQHAAVFVAEDHARSRHGT
jgi:MFS family permease